MSDKLVNKESLMLFDVKRHLWSFYTSLIYTPYTYIYTNLRIYCSVKGEMIRSLADHSFLDQSIMSSIHTIDDGYISLNYYYRQSSSAW